MEEKLPRVEIEVSLTTVTPDPERHIELCGREAYGSAQGPTLEDARNWIRKRITGWELDVLEHSVATFHVVGSRVWSHEQVRHRIASYTQRSMRFSESAVEDFIVPPEIKQEDVQDFETDVKAVQEFYSKWKDKGYARQTARYFIPHAAMTSMYFTMNFRELRHFIVMRSAKMAQPEMKVIADKVSAICLGNWPSCFEDLDQELVKRGWK